MAYFGNSHIDGALHRLEPRTIFLIVWVLLCLFVLWLILRGDKQAPLPSHDFIRTTNQHAAPDAPVPTKVLIAKTAIAIGQKLSPDLFEMAERVRAVDAQPVIAHAAMLREAFAARALEVHDELLEAAVSYTAPESSVTAKIADGFRALTIAVDTESGVEGWVRAGAHVDVIWISHIKGREAARTIVENAEILSAEHSTDVTAPRVHTSTMPSHVTLMVSVKDAQRLQLAKSSGSLSLSLRGSHDSNAVQAEGGAPTLLENLLSEEQDPKQRDTLGWVKIGGQSFMVQADGSLKSVRALERAEGLRVEDGLYAAQ